jgi:glycosyltransferase involved in cell wall biosynthesis
VDKIIAIRYGMQNAHAANEAWFEAIGVSKSRPFNLTKSARILKSLGSYNQILALVHSLIMPRAKFYLLTSPGCTLAAVFKKKLFNSKIISINSDTFFVDLLRTKGLRRKYMLWLIKHIDGIVSTSNFMKKIARQFTKVPNEVVYPYCDTQRFLKVSPKKQSQNITSVGIGFNTKGSDILLKAFEKYHQTFPKSKLFLCGHKEDLNGLKTPEGVVLTGIVKPEHYLSRSGLYINASRHESFGVNIIEAMCAGLPTIITNRCGAREIVSQISKELVVECDSDSIANKAIQLMKDSSKRNRIGEKSKQKGKNFTKKSSQKNFKAEISKIMKTLK